MNFLIYNDKQGDLTNILKTMQFDFTVHTVADYDDFFHHYSINTYDVIIINYFSNVWNKLLNEIDIMNKNEKIILLSDTYECSQNNNCLSCQENYNININIKPIIESEIINIHTIKPLDEEIIIKSAKKTGAVVSAEEHNFLGGLGESISRTLSLNHPVPQEFIATNDTFGESGTPSELMKKYRLDSNSIVEAVKKVISRKK